MSLEKRRARFLELGGHFECEKPDPLLVVPTIEPALFNRLRIAVALYVSKCIPGNQTFLDESELMEAFVKNRATIRNCTPNGMLVPKRHLILEYNAVIQAFIAVIDSLNIGDFISSWHIPLNMRFKDGEAVKENLVRNHPTEHTHSDSWAGESSASVTTIIPLFGDTERNRVDYFSPPENFDESWLGPLPSYADGARYAEKYTRIRSPFEKGKMIIADFAMLHASTRHSGSGPRLSIDTTFAMPNLGEKEVIHEWRLDERASHQDLQDIGVRKLFLFPDTNEDQVDSRGGYKHPTNLAIAKLLD